MDNTAQQYAEQLFESIDLIYQNKSNQVSFDRTVVCEVVGTYKDTPNKYLVSTGALKFDAYTQSELKYSKGTQVYVLIPGGDYGATKVIIGNYNIDKELSKQLYTNPFDYLVYKQKYTFEKIALGSLQDCDIDIYTKGISNYNCIGIDFSLTTSGIEDTRGEYHIVLSLLDENEELALLPFTSKQLYGNPYNLNGMLRFEHIFDFPTNITNLSTIKKLKVSLVSEDGYAEDAVILNDINVYFGFNTDKNTDIKNNQVKLYLDNDTELNYDGETDLPEKLTLYIDWRKNDTDVIYSGLPNGIAPEKGEEENWNIYWLQYRPNNEGETSKDDIDEAGVYWTTKKKIGVSEEGAYSFDIREYINFRNHMQEQFKVIVKNDITGEYIESNGLTFSNTAWSAATADNGDQPLLLTLSDDGIYNNYGIDNKRLDTDKETQVTADFPDNREWKDDDIKSIIWKVPAAASMFEKPYILNDNGALQDDPNWNDDSGFYVRSWFEKTETETDTEEAPKTITVFRDDQFDYNKTNNTVYCIVETMDGIIYSGSITLQFGTQGTSGSGYSFNIRPDRYGPLAMPYINEKDEEVNPYIKFTAYLENNNGEAVEFDGKNVTWNVIQGSTNRPVKSTKDCTTVDGVEVHREWAPIGDSVILRANKDEEIEQVTIVSDLEGKEIFNQEDILYETLPYYNILMATLNEWTDTNGNEIKLTAYYPIPYTESSECINYYISGATRVVYNAQGTSRNYDESPYVLYGSDSQPIENVEWSVLTIEDDISLEDYGKPKVAENGDNCPGLELLKDNSGLKKLSPINLPTDVKPCSIIAYSDNTILWAQPLLMIRNNYAYPMVNSWDGGLTIDDEGNYILTELIGAGTKDKDNKYTGVLMGSIGKTGAAATTGLYGFNTGELRYKLDEKGNFYVGTGNDNKIDFNNSDLTIAAEHFKLKIGDNLYFGDVAEDENNNKPYWLRFKDKVYFNTNGDVTIGGWNINTNYLGHLDEEGHSNNNYFISQTGLWGQMYNPMTKEFDSFNCYLFFKEKFAIDTEGQFYATSGRIGGWQIQNQYFYATDNTNTIAFDFDAIGTTKKCFAIGAVKYDGSWSNAYFAVDGKGKLYAKGAEISGDAIFSGQIKADSVLLDGVTFGGSGGTIFKDYILYDERIGTKWATTTDAYNNLYKLSQIKMIEMLNQGFIDIEARSTLNNTYTGISMAPESAGLYGNWTGTAAMSIDSDINLKHEIAPLSTQYSHFFDNLRPVIYKYNNGTSDRLHTGFIAQEVNEALQIANINSKDFAGLVIFDKETENERWTLRYEEFIALNTSEIQKAKARITELEKEIKEIKQNEI